MAYESQLPEWGCYNCHYYVYNSWDDAEYCMHVPLADGVVFPVEEHGKCEYWERDERDIEEDEIWTEETTVRE